MDGHEVEWRGAESVWLAEALNWLTGCVVWGLGVWKMEMTGSGVGERCGKSREAEDEKI